MKTATLQQAQRDMQHKVISGAAIYPHHIANAVAAHYTITLHIGSPQDGDELTLVDVRDHQPRQFRTLDAAHRCLLQIGFEINPLYASAL